MKETLYVITLHQADEAPVPSLKAIEEVLTSTGRLCSQVGTTLDVHRVGTDEWTEPIVIPPPPPARFTLQSITIDIVEPES